MTIQPNTMRILIWNVRGAVREVLHVSLRNYIRHYNPIVTVIFDTRMTYEEAAELVLCFGYPNRMILSPLASSPQSGGFWVMWNEARLDVHLEVASDRVLHFRLISPHQPLPIELTTVYNEATISRQPHVWESLRSLSNSVSGSWLIAGVFNSLLHSHEKSGGGKFRSARSRAFSSCLNDCGLYDLGYCGSMYTWTNSSLNSNLIFEHLDRACANSFWFNRFPLTSMRILPKAAFDHKPLLIDTNDEIRPPRQIFCKYENIWRHNTVFVNNLKDFWASTTVSNLGLHTNS